MNVVGFREEEESFDLLIRNSVVVSFTTQSHKVGIDVDV